MSFMKRAVPFSKYSTACMHWHRALVHIASKQVSLRSNVKLFAETLLDRLCVVNHLGHWFLVWLRKRIQIKSGEPVLTLTLLKLAVLFSFTFWLKLQIPNQFSINKNVSLFFNHSPFLFNSTSYFLTFILLLMFFATTAVIGWAETPNS